MRRGQVQARRELERRLHGLSRLVSHSAHILKFHAHARSHTTPTHAHTSTEAFTDARALARSFVLAAACPSGEYLTGCGGLQFHDDSSDTRAQLL